MAILASACSDPSTTGVREPTHLALVVGRVVSDKGVPLDQARIFIRIPNRESYGYSVSEVMTDRAGVFSYLVQRMNAPIRVDTPDTVTVEVQALLMRPDYYKADGTSPVGLVTTLLTFVPMGRLPSSIQVEIPIVLPPK